MRMTLGVLLIVVGVVAHVLAECDVITNRLDHIEDSQENMYKQLMKKQEELQLQLKKKMSELEKKLSRRSAFSATIIGTNNYYKGSVQIRFPAVRYNLGQHYDAGTSEYTCPYDGVYLFQLSILTARQGIKVGVGIFKAGHSLAWVFEEGAYHTGAVTTVTECKAGEKVVVKSRHGSAIYLHGDTIPVFSGAYLYPSY
eukprot:GHVR01026421.1.p1 GENE.GHVR01026421.1~~GHVR01026421.1.p1  ORF type:complete len:198 (-),score=10.90 GHVR01026421.1:62-655(-)